MSWLMLSQVAELAGGQLLGQDCVIDSLSIDSRTIKTNDLFIALKGEHFDGHDYVGFIEHDAAAIMVSRPVQCSCPQIQVSDTLLALTTLAKNWRQQISAPLIGLTGSNGKTTVKEMIASVLGCGHSFYATRGNLNNHIGVPLSLLSVRPEHEYVVIEMGANHLHEIAALTQAARPDVALITNAGPAHLQGFGSLDGVAHGKGEIFQGLTDEGIAVLNADDVYYEFWSGLCGSYRRISFGFSADAEVRGQLRENNSLHVATSQGTFEVNLSLPGRHNAANALAATAASLAVGISIDDVRTGLEQVKAVTGRLVASLGIKGCTVFDDTYNANPASLQAALEVAVQRPGTHWLVLGEMGELGEQAVELHTAAGHMAREMGFDALLAVGELSRHSARSFGIGGVHFPSLDALNSYITDQIYADVTVLVKGSRLMHMERVVEKLTAVDTRAAHHRDQQYGETDHAA